MLNEEREQLMLREREKERKGGRDGKSRREKTLTSSNTAFLNEPCCVFFKDSRASEPTDAFPKRD